MTKGVWKLQEVRDQVLNRQWRCYDFRREVGTLWVWGGNSQGQLGQNDTTHRSSPVQLPGTNWSSMSLGYNFGFSLKGDNTLWSWGYNLQGRLGHNNLIPRSSPVQIPGTAWCSVSAGSDHGLALKSDNTLWAWGNNGCSGHSGWIGDGTVTNRSSPVQVPGTAWVEISAASQSSFGRKSDGTLWSWGRNDLGQLGQNNTAVVNSPVQIPGTSWVEISSNKTHITCQGTSARKSDGTIWGWGLNNGGQLSGDGLGTVPRSSPVLLPGSNWCLVRRGTESAFGMKPDNLLFTWGSGRAGALGLNCGTTGAVAQAQIPGLWEYADTNFYSSFGLKKDNTLWSWGTNGNGQLGTNSTQELSSPVQIPGTSWIDVAPGRPLTVARKYT